MSRTPLLSTSQFLLMMVLLQVDSSHAGYQHMVEGDTSSSKIEQCPPKVVSSPEEVAHYCHAVPGQRFELNKFQYQCFGGEHTMCSGEVKPQKELPTCSQPVVASCEDEMIYTNFNDHSRGPCYYRAYDLVWHSAKCGGGQFSCWDPSLNQWCQGTVDDSSVSSENIECPPTNVYSQHEATHYCSKSGLATRIDPKNTTNYSCYLKDGSAVCTGKIDGRRPPSCSIRIANCDAIDKVCEPGRKTFCSEETSVFECWDKDIDRWCLGQVVKPYTRAGVKAASEPNKRPLMAPPSSRASNIAPERIHKNFVIPMGLVMVLFVLAGTIFARAFHMDATADSWKSIPSPAELGYYQPVSDGMELTTLVA